MHTISSKLAFIESIFGKGDLAANGKNFSVRCPICAPTDRNKKKLAIRVEDDAHHCWTCGWSSYSLAPLIRKFGTVAHLQRYKSEFIPERLKHIKEKSVSEEASQITKLPSDFKLLTQSSLQHPDVKAAWSYLTKRDISLRDAWHYKLGISNDPRWKRRVIMPSFDSEGNFNFFIARNIDFNDKRTKYDNPEDNKSLIVFNEINIDWNKQLVICEGPFDLMKCGDNATALLGSDLSINSRLFSQILLHNTPVALALDGDMWSEKTPKLAKLFQSYDIDVVIVDTRDHKDPGNMSKKQFKLLLSEAKAPTWENIFFDKLEKISKISLRLKC
jgi:hypothetical protein